MTTETRRLTYDEYLALPETPQRYDIVDGVMQMAPAPIPLHQWVMQEIFVRLRSFVMEHNLGVTLVAPVDVVIQREPLRTRQPDILYLSAARSGIRGPADLRGLPVVELPPDLVVEVLSPSNTRRDMEERLSDYRSMGVLECWLVSPEAETIEVLYFSSQESGPNSIYNLDGVLQSQVLASFSLRLRDIFRS